MANIIIIGAQWGDEGKGKIVDLLTEKFDIVARYQGGHNAGHTVTIKGTQFILHLIPSGILHGGRLCVIGPGVVLDPKAFFEEFDMLEKAGIEVRGNLFISNRAHLILPYHRAVENAAEKARGAKKIGTTSRGIGPAYEDKIARRGLRVVDLFDEGSLKETIFELTQEKNCLIKALYGGPPLDAGQIYREYLQYGQRLKEFVVDTAFLLNDQIRKGKSVLFEGAQGTLLDIDHGTYPYVTSSNVTAGAAFVGLLPLGSRELSELPRPIPPEWAGGLSPPKPTVPLETKFEHGELNLEPLRAGPAAADGSMASRLPIRPS